MCMKSQRMISIGDDNMIENGRELCKIQEHMLRAKDSMEIEDPGGAGRSVRTDITTMPVAIGHILPAEYFARCCRGGAAGGKAQIWTICMRHCMPAIRLTAAPESAPSARPRSELQC